MNRVNLTMVLISKIGEIFLLLSKGDSSECSKTQALKLCKELIELIVIYQNKYGINNNTEFMSMMIHDYCSSEVYCMLPNFDRGCVLKEEVLPVIQVLDGFCRNSALPSQDEYFDIFKFISRTFSVLGIKKSFKDFIYDNFSISNGGVDFDKQKKLLEEETNDI